MKLSRIGAAVALVLGFVPLAGCGGGTDNRAVVNGKLVDGAKPFTLDPAKLKLPPGATGLPPGARPVAVVLIAVEGGERFPANVDTDGTTFSVPGPDGKGIKPGRYKIAITAGVGGGDYFGGKYSPEQTPIVRDVNPGEQLVIDVSKPQG